MLMATSWRGFNVRTKREGVPGFRVEPGGVGDVALPSRQGHGSVPRFLVEDAGRPLGFYEPRGLDGTVSLDDGQGSLSLQGEGALVSHGSFTAVLPLGPPRDGTSPVVGIPDGLGAGANPFRVWFAASGGDCVNDLPVVGVGSVPVEVRGQVLGSLGYAGANNEPQARLVKGVQVPCGEHARDRDHVSDLVAFLERFDHGNDCLRLGLVALDAVDL